MAAVVLDEDLGHAESRVELEVEGEGVVDAAIALHANLPDRVCKLSLFPCHVSFCCVS